jgi:hypothetical protein
MRMSKERRWGRIAAEGLVIVASILLALAGDAWIEDRRDRTQERSEVEGLRAQLTETRALLLEAIENDERNIGLTQALITAAESGLRDGRIQVVDSLVQAEFASTFFDPPLARFESIIASGRLGLIQDDELRALIADWPNIARWPQFGATSRREMFRNQFIPYLLEDYDLDDWYGPPPTGEIVELHVDNEFINLLKVRQWINGVVLGRERDVLVRLGALVSRIDAWE